MERSLVFDQERENGKTPSPMPSRPRLVEPKEVLKVSSAENNPSIMNIRTTKKVANIFIFLDNLFSQQVSIEYKKSYSMANKCIVL